MTTVAATLRVLAVDDHPAVRAGLSSLFAAEDGLELVGGAATVREAVTLSEELRPDVVVLDVHLPDGDGLGLCLRLQAADPAPAA